MVLSEICQPFVTGDKALVQGIINMGLENILFHIDSFQGKWWLDICRIINISRKSLKFNFLLQILLKLICKAPNDAYYGLVKFGALKFI